MNPDSLVGIDVNLSFASGGQTHQLVAGQGPATTIKIWRAVLTVALPASIPYTVLTMYSGATALPGSIILKDGGAVTLDTGRRRWWMTADNQPLRIGLSTEGTMRGGIAYEVHPW